jgi:hypothetical protein
MRDARARAAPPQSRGFRINIPGAHEPSYSLREHKCLADFTQRDAFR